MSARREILVGVSLSLTGRFSLQGRQAFEGMRLWEFHVNAEGGLRVAAEQRRPVRLLCYDDESRARRARENALRLLREDLVHVLFGPYSSGLTLAVARIAKGHNKLLWNHGGTSDALFQRGLRCLVSVGTPASDYFRELPAWLARERPGVGRACVLHARQGTFAAHVARGFEEAARATRMEIERIAFDPSLKEVEAMVGELRCANPQIVVLAGSFQDEVRFLRTRSSWPGSIRRVAAVSAGIQAFYDALKEGSEGVIGTSQWEPKVAVGKIRGPDSDWFARNFQKRFGRRPDYTAAAGFALGLVFAECARQAGTLGDAHLREVANELDINTFFGRFRLDPENSLQVGHRMVLIQWRQGRKVILSEGEAAGV